MTPQSSFEPATADTPPERFNVAAHLLALNAGRGDRPAYIDDTGPLSAP